METGVTEEVDEVVAEALELTLKIKLMNRAAALNPRQRKAWLGLAAHYRRRSADLLDHFCERLRAGGPGSHSHADD